MMAESAIGRHVGALGVAVAGDGRLCGRFASGAFIGEHGSWNRVPVSGYKVVFVPFGAHGFPVATARPIDVLTRFPNAVGEARGRPVAVLGAPAGPRLGPDDVGTTDVQVAACRPRARRGGVLFHFASSAAYPAFAWPLSVVLLCCPVARRVRCCFVFC